MHLSTILLALMGASSVIAHHVVSNIWVDGVNQGPGTCMRLPLNTSPVKDVNSAEMACNVNGGKQVGITCAANAGSTITVQWRIWPDGSNDGPLDVSHQGPCAVYMKKMGAKGSGDVTGGGWFKIWHDGFRDGEFCTNRIRKNNNRMDVKIPSDLASGYYTFRAESLALHQGQNYGGAQWYIGCAQLFVYSTGGNASPKNTVSIPGYVTAKHPGVLYDWWTKKGAGYVIPGPEPYIKTNSGGGQPQKVPFYSSKYPECLVKNANWCGVSPPPYHNEATCWKSSENCWSQLSACYNEAPITGNKGCVEWENKCAGYKDRCNACSYSSCPSKKPKRGVPINKGSERGHRHHFRV